MNLSKIFLARTDDLALTNSKSGQPMMNDPMQTPAAVPASSTTSPSTKVMP